MRLAAAALLAALALPAAARDLNRQNYLLGERAAGMGGAMVALTGDAASTYYNPAGLAGLYRKGISLSASAYQVSLETYSKELDIPLTSGDHLTTGMSSATFATFPASIVYTLPLDANREPGAFHHVVAFSVLLPDQDKLRAVVDMPVGNYQFELKGTFANQDQTYWIGPTYAVSMGGRLRLGASVFATVHMTDFQANLAVKLGTVTGETRYAATAQERSGYSLSALAQLGAQLDLDDRWTVGATVRSPTLGRLYSSMRWLAINSRYAEDGSGVPVPGMPGYVDRMEARDGLTLEQRLPLVVAAGVSYHRDGQWAAALDATYHAAVPAYRRVSGDLLHPTNTYGQPILDPDRALDPVEYDEAAAVLDLNVGFEANLSATWLWRAGLFTDLSAVKLDSVAADPSRPQLARVGVSMGLGRIGERSTTSFGLVYVAGFGKAPGMNAWFDVPANQASVTSHTVTAVLSGSADL